MYVFLLKLHIMSYHFDKYLDGETKITGALLVAAEKYMITDLVCICVDYFERNLSDQNVMEVMTASFMINQKELFDSACKLILKDTSKIFTSEAWKTFEEKDPMLALKMLKNAVLKSEEKIGSQIVASVAWKKMQKKDPMLALEMLKEAMFNSNK